MRTIAIQTPDGPLNVRASIFGPLAVHQTVYGSPVFTTNYNITAPCGLRVGPILPLRKLAVALCHDLLAIEGVNWHITEVGDWDNATLKAVKAVCAKYRD